MGMLIFHGAVIAFSAIMTLVSALAAKIRSKEAEHMTDSFADTINSEEHFSDANRERERLFELQKEMLKAQQSAANAVFYGMVFVFYLTALVFGILGK